MRPKKLPPVSLHRAGGPTMGSEPPAPRRRLRSTRIRIDDLVELTWRVTLHPRSWDEVRQLSRSNTRQGGLFVCTATPPPTGTAVEIALRLPDGEQVIVTGTVVHSVGKALAEERGKLHGFGLQMDQEHATALALLEVQARPKCDLEATDTGFDIAAELRHRDAREQPTPARVLPLSKQKVPTLETRALRLDAAPVFGIDIGASFCRIALVTRDSVRVLKDEAGRTQLPTAVAYLGTLPIVGWEALSLAAQGHHCVVDNPKLFLGRRSDDVRLKRALRTASFQHERGDNGEILIRSGGERLSMVDVFSAILSTLKRIGEKATGMTPRRVVLSLPQGASDRQRSMLRAAAHVAELEVVALIEESVAAAKAHGLGKGEGALLAIYDFGASSFNCSVLEIQRERCRVIATGGDPWLGGASLDCLLAEHAASFYASYRGRPLRETALWAQLLRRCERLKWQLSMFREVTLEPLRLDGKALGPALTITRALLAELGRELVQRTIQQLDLCLREAGVEGNELDGVIMVGGMSRSPMVQQLLERHYGPRVEISELPGEAVVVGNALHGRMLQLSSAASMPLKFGSLTHSAA